MASALNEARTRACSRCAAAWATAGSRTASRSPRRGPADRRRGPEQRRRARRSLQSRRRGWQSAVLPRQLLPARYRAAIRRAKERSEPAHRKGVDAPALRPRSRYCARALGRLPTPRTLPRSGPSPTMVAVSFFPCARGCAIASISTSTPLSRRSSPTKTRSVACAIGRNRNEFSGATPLCTTRAQAGTFPTLAANTSRP